MTQEEKQLLMKDLFARLPYGVTVRVEGDWFYDKKEPYDCKLTPHTFTEQLIVHNGNIMPYLRPMSSMTDEELKELNDKYGNIAYFFIQDPPYYHGLQAQHSDIGSIEISEFSEIYDWLDAHYFDYRIVPSTGKTLIESGLALESLADMYKTE